MQAGLLRQAGLFRQHVSVQVRTEASDGHDGVVETWATRHARVPAQVTPLTGRDLERARQVDPRISHEVRLLYWRAHRADLVGGRARLVYHDLADRTFEIVSPPIDVQERHEVLVLQCREVA